MGSGAMQVDYLGKQARRCVGLVGDAQKPLAVVDFQPQAPDAGHARDLTDPCAKRSLDRGSIGGLYQWPDPIGWSGFNLSS